MDLTLTWRSPMVAGNFLGIENMQSINPGGFDHDIKIHQEFLLLNEKNKFLVRRVIGADPTLIPAAEVNLDCV